MSESERKSEREKQREKLRTKEKRIIVSNLNGINFRNSFRNFSHTLCDMWRQQQAPSTSICIVSILLHLCSVLHFILGAHAVSQGISNLKCAFYACSQIICSHFNRNSSAAERCNQLKAINFSPVLWWNAPFFALIVSIGKREKNQHSIRSWTVWLHKKRQECLSKIGKYSNENCIWSDVHGLSSFIVKYAVAFFFALSPSVSNGFSCSFFPHVCLMFYVVVVR